MSKDTQAKIQLLLKQFKFSRKTSVKSTKKLKKISFPNNMTKT